MNKFWIGLSTVVALALVWGTSLLIAGPQPGHSFFDKSLHHRGEGMRYWYEKDDGFMQITGVPYDELSCKNCHIKTCDPCHAEKKGEAMTFSTEKARKTETCLPCDGREALSMKFDKQADKNDVHFAADMACADCHEGEDVHGNGKEYTSMRQKGALNARCENCHKKESEEAPAFDTDIIAHKQHNKSHHCAACHVQSTMACMNCHFGEFLATGKKKGNFIPAKDWLLLINYEGKITSATAMTFVHKKMDKPNAKGEPFVVYAPYFTHSVSKKGRDCYSCHGTEAVKSMNNGSPLRMSTYKDGQLDSFKGVVPVIPGLLKWEYLDKKDGQWIVLPVDEEVKYQMACYGTALTKKQLKKLAAPQHSENK
jgi:hypothetical protein